MRICFCDDEASTRSQFERMAAAWEEQRGEAAELQLYNSAEQLLFEVGQPEAQELAFDLILLDIQMGGMDGITLARQLRAQDKRVTLAFLTAAREYVFEGYEVQAVRYLLKPMQQEKVFELLDLARQNLQEQPSLILNCADEKKKIYLSQIAAIEAYRVQTQLILAQSERPHSVEDLAEVSETVPDTVSRLASEV